MQRDRWFRLALLAVVVAGLPACSPMYVRPNLGYEKVPALGLTGTPTKSTVLGGGLEVAGMFKPESKWGWHGAGSYGFGGTEFEQAVTGDEFKSKLTNWNVRFGIDYRTKFNEVEMYGGPSIVYGVTQQTFEQTGFPDDELEDNKFIGLQTRMGWAKPISEKVFLYGEIHQTIGRATIDDEVNLGGKFTSWQNTHGYRGGVQFGY